MYMLLCAVILNQLVIKPVCCNTGFEVFTTPQYELS